MSLAARKSVLLTFRIVNKLLPLGLFGFIALLGSQAQSAGRSTKTNMAFTGSKTTSMKIQGNRNNPPRTRISIGRTIRTDSLSFSRTRQNENAGTGSPATGFGMTFTDSGKNALTINTASQRKTYFSHFANSINPLKRLAGNILPSANRNQIPAGESPASDPLELIFFPSFGGFIQLGIASSRGSQFRFILLTDL